MKRRWLFALLRPGWPDEARLIVQQPVFARLLGRAPPGGSCLNIGSGEGLFLRFLNDIPELSRIVHADLQPPDLGEWCSDLRNESAVASLTRLPFADSEFDFVFCTEVLEHIEDDVRALRQIARVLRPGGTVLLSTPTPPAPADPAHVREGYTFPELTEKLSAVGIDATDHEFCFHFAMRALLKAWRWQYALARGRRSYMPRAVVRAFGYCDRWFPLGKPWDVVVVGRKRASA
jgi:SAM-dependent methyltransferase